MQRFDALSILVTALVFLGLSAGIFVLIKDSLRVVTPYGVVRIRPTRPFFVVGASASSGHWSLRVCADTGCYSSAREQFGPTTSKLCGCSVRPYPCSS
jgi:hypothetical protein